MLGAAQLHFVYDTVCDSAILICVVVKRSMVERGYNYRGPAFTGRVIPVCKRPLCKEQLHTCTVTRLYRCGARLWCHSHTTLDMVFFIFTMSDVGVLSCVKPSSFGSCFTRILSDHLLAKTVPNPPSVYRAVREHII